ncbi:MAG TPA: hypothetical protein VLX68_08370 [Chitinivibrionales bacterium]|nr:hypothetical protein [Chitinivibrionales bacterium]
MKKIAFVAGIAVAVFCAHPARADLSLVQQAGEGARALGMGNNYVALSSDLSAMFWNPAGFAFVPARELAVSFEGLSQRNDATFSQNGDFSSLSRPRLDNIGYLHAFPTVQGGFTLAASYHSPYTFDDVLAFSGDYLDVNNHQISLDNNYKTYGGLDFWSGGFGLQVAKGLGIGAAVSLVTGTENVRTTLLRLTDGAIADPINDDYDRTTTRSYVGYDIRLGMLYQPVKFLNFGLRFVFPQTVWFTEDLSETYPYTPSEPDYNTQYTGKLMSSYSGAFGGALVFPFLTASGEIRTRLPYSVLYPLATIPDTSLASKTMWGAGLGLEVPCGVSWILARAGFSWDQFDTHLFLKQYSGEDPGWDPQGLSPVGDRLMGTLGMGFIIRRVCLEWAYSYGAWRLNTENVLTENHVQQRLMMSVAFRF